MVAGPSAGGSPLVTGEAVALDLRPAALPTRLLAGLIDLSITVVAFLLVGALFTRVAAGTSPAGAAALGIVAALLCFLALPVACEALWRGRTPGKAALGLRVVRDDGGPIGFRHAFVRGLVGVVAEKPGVTVGVVAVLTSLGHPQGKRLGDLLAGTLVLQERVPGGTTSRGPVAQMPPALAGWAASLDLGRLSPQLALSVRQYLARAPQLTDAARATLGQQLLDAVLAATSPPPPPGAPGWAVLSAVLAERRRREEERSGATRAAAPPTSPTSQPSPPADPQTAPPTTPPTAPHVAVPPAPPAPSRATPETGPGGFAPPL